MISIRLAGIFLLALALLAGRSALTAADKEAHDKPTAEHKDDAKPKKDDHGDAHGPKTPFPWELDLGIWALVVFLLLFLLLGRFAWKPILEGLQKREHNIKSAIEEARVARAEAEGLSARLQAELNKAGEKVREILDEARRDAQFTKDELIATARAEIQTERERLRREIDTARDQAVQELWNQTAQLATLISAKAIGRELTSGDHRRLIDEALSDLGDAVIDFRRVRASGNP